jgi:hypothetical protein
MFARVNGCSFPTQFFLSAALLVFGMPAFSQNASLTGAVKDPQGAVVPGAIVALTDVGKQVPIKTVSNQQGLYEFPIVPPGSYALKAEAPGFSPYHQSPVTLQVDQRARADIMLAVSGSSAVVEVNANVSGVQTESSSVGDVIESKTISDVPLNGRFFLDLAQLVPGSVLASTNNRSGSTTASAFGAFSINSSGARSDSASFMLDGINLNDGSQIEFQPSIESVQEFKVQSNSFSAEYGRTAGIIINSVTKSGTNSLHGTLFEFLRNDKLDALNFFDPPRAVEQVRTGESIAPFKRNIFGESIGGPVVLPGYNGKNKTFFFESYEGRRLRETETFTTTVPTVAQRSAVTNPAVAKLLTLLPLPNNPNSSVNNFTGQAPRDFNLDNTTVRIDHDINSYNLLFGTVIYQPDNRNEASSLGTHNIPGFGDHRVGHRKLLSLGFTHIFSPNLTGEFRAGGNRINLNFQSQANMSGLTPGAFGLDTGVTDNFPDFRISGGPAFGGLSGFPQGRTDTTTQANAVMSWLRGAHAIKFGFDYRGFYNNSYNDGTGGVINFSSIANFLAGNPVTATLKVGASTPALSIPAYGGFIQDDYKVTSRLTLNLGLRYEYFGVPSARHNGLEIFSLTTDQFTQVGTNGAYLYKADLFDLGPRVGLAWDPDGKGHTVVRAGAGIYYDEPLLGAASAAASNPPYSTNYTYSYTGIPLATPFVPGPTSALSPNAIASDYKPSRTPQYNFNIQHQAWSTVFQLGYIGSVGRRLPITVDANQGVNGLRPIKGYGVISYYESVARSSYNAMWFSANRRLAKGLTFDASYTLSKSIDTSSTSGNSQIQNSYNLNVEKGLSDFDARNRVVASVLYQLPWKASRLKPVVNGWDIGVVGNYQSGNPFSPIISSLRSGSLDAYDRPNVVYGQSLTVANPSPNEWFNTAAFSLNPIDTFGNAGRNILTGPPFRDVDLSLMKNFLIRERATIQFRAECFNISNTPNFGQPGNSVTAGNFGVIQATRSQRGDFGSSRQIEFALKVIF